MNILIKRKIQKVNVDIFQLIFLLRVEVILTALLQNLQIFRKIHNPSPTVTIKYNIKQSIIFYFIMICT